MKLARVMIATLLCLVAVRSVAADSKEEQQTAIRTMAQQTLQRLYQAQPAAKSAVESAAGYAVFSNMGVKILVAGSGTGKGMAVNNQTKAETFMKMVEVQGGLGFGVKKFSVIFVFANDKVLDNFVNSGWQFGGEATAAAKTSPEKGGAMEGATAVSDGVYMYQMTDKGLAAELALKSTKYYKDKDLN